MTKKRNGLLRLFTLLFIMIVLISQISAYVISSNVIRSGHNAIVIEVNVTESNATTMEYDVIRDEDFHERFKNVSQAIRDTRTYFPEDRHPEAAIVYAFVRKYVSNPSYPMNVPVDTFNLWDETYPYNYTGLVSVKDYEVLEGYYQHFRNNVNHNNMEVLSVYENFKSCVNFIR